LSDLQALINLILGKEVFPDVISFGEAFSGGGYGVFDIVEDFSLDKGDKGIESLRE
jgi:hypothetical protein